ncbi:MAG TPA: hypothetical protein VMW06_10795 [Desulfobacterales bacterium]|nr:hypothetical protein [Desulfobacterales bacterium]
MTENTQEKPNDRPKNAPKEFALIKFPGKTRKQDPDIIYVRVNGNPVRMKRIEFIPVKLEVVHALRNATEPVVESEDSAGGDVDMVRRRKVVSHAPRFPFELVGWITAKDFNKLRKIALKRSITDQEADKAIYG